MVQGNGNWEDYDQSIRGPLCQSFLLTSLLPLLRCGCFPWVAVIQNKPASAWALDRLHFLHKICSCSRVRSSMTALWVIAPPWSLYGLHGNICFSVVTPGAARDPCWGAWITSSPPTTLLMVLTVCFSHFYSHIWAGCLQWVHWIQLESDVSGTEQPWPLFTEEFEISLLLYAHQCIYIKR